MGKQYHDDSVLSAKDVCELLQVKQSQLKRMVENGQIVAPFTSGKWRWFFSSIKHLITKDVSRQPRTILGKHMLSLDEIADWMSIPASKIRAWTKDGSFPPPMKIAKAWRWSANDLQDFLDSCRLKREPINLVKPIKAFVGNIPQQLTNLGPYLQRANVGISPCVYFLIKNGLIVYIGSSIRLMARLGQHKDKDFDDVLFVNVDSEKMLEIELNYIRIYQPPLNFVGTINDKPTGNPDADVLRKLLPCWDLTAVASTC